MPATPVCLGDPKWVTLLLGRSGHTPRRPEAARKREPEEQKRPVSEGTRAHGPQGGRSGERGIEEHSSSDTNTTTVENFKGPKGKGVHPKLVQELLGHATIAITLDTYSRVLPGMGDAAAGAMDAALG